MVEPADKNVNKAILYYPNVQEGENVGIMIWEIQDIFKYLNGIYRDTK